MFTSENLLSVVIELYDIIKPIEEKEKVFTFIHSVCCNSSKGIQVVNVLCRTYKLSEYKKAKVKEVIGINLKNSYN